MRLFKPHENYKPPSQPKLQQSFLTRSDPHNAICSESESILGGAAVRFLPTSRYYPIAMRVAYKELEVHGHQIIV
jgi:hypothetical protein